MNHAAETCRRLCAFARTVGQAAVLAVALPATADAQSSSPQAVLWQRALPLAEPDVRPEKSDLDEILPPASEVTRQVLPAVRKALTDPDSSVRAEAVLTLGALGTREDLPTLRALLKETDLSIRHRAILALGMLQDTAAAGSFILLLDTQDSTPRERGLAMLSLGLLPEGTGHPRIAERLGMLRGKHLDRSRDEFLAGVLGLGLRPNGTGRGALETLLEDASFREPALRAAALAALAVVAPGSPHLARALRERSPEVRLAATLALACARGSGPGTSEATPQLLRMLAKDPEPLVRCGALLALGCRRSEDLLEQSDHLATGSDELLRPYALLHLGMVGGEAQRRELRAAIDRPMTPLVQAAHLRALGALADLGSTGRFRALLVDAGAPVAVRIAAAAALARLHDSHALALLRDQFFRAEDPELLLGFALAARQLAAREGIARDPEPVDEAAARPQAAWSRYLVQVRALGAAGSRGLMPVLLKLLDGPGGGARARAAALASLRDYLAPDCRHPGVLLARLPARPLDNPLLRDIEGWFQPRL